MSRSVPSKIFLLGEYAVMKGLPAVIAAIGPRFTLSDEKNPGSSEFAEASPAGRLLRFAGQASPSVKGVFHDPFSGAGGFGASTAQFALTYLSLTRQKDAWRRDWLTVWSLYRRLMRPDSGEALTPSGADLVAQWEGGVRLFQIVSEQEARTEDLSGLLDWSHCMVFSATDQQGRKVATHQHLEALKTEGLEKVAQSLKAPLEAGIRAIQDSDIGMLGRAMMEYGETLYHAGLEAEETHCDRMALSALPKVLGAKGAGAMQSDAIVLLIDPSATSEDRRRILREAENRKLRLVSESLRPELGIQE